MVLKTFNIDEQVHRRFSSFCKEHGISMSKQIQMFMETFIADEPEVRPSYLKKLERIRKGKFIRVKSIKDHYGLK